MRLQDAVIWHYNAGALYAAQILGRCVLPKSIFFSTEIALRGKYGGNELNGFVIDKGKKITEKCFSPFQSQNLT